MPLAIVLRVDAATAGFIDAMTYNLPDRPDYDPRRSYPPHIRLAVFDDAMDAGDVDAALATATGRWQAMPITLVGIGVFPSDPAVVWLAPMPTAELLALHATLRRTLADFAYHPHYEIGGWMPHVVMARTKLLADAVEVLATTWMEPIVGWLDCLDLVRLDPIEVLSRRPLRS